MSLKRVFRVGFVTEHQRGTYSIHPLLREFLHHKLFVMDASSKTDRLNRAMEFLLREESWEDAFALVRNFALHDHIEPLLSTAMYDLLANAVCFYHFRIC